MPTILLVDDDPLQASVRKAILDKRFPGVQRVSDAAEALCLVEQPQFVEDLGLVISGHHTHGIGGPAFVAELQARLPSLKILVLGGPDEQPVDYTGNGICFRPRALAAEELLKLAGQMLQPR